MQMPNASPQGIAGLMQQRPQAPQMPTPGKASPMAGLGTVDDRVSAYQGNTKPLEQRYAMTQDLLDLLALQKIKSQKEAAARQMQLQMAQQSAESGQANMTVAQQREQEVDALTKNELAQQRGDTAQKQAGDQQAAMQKMMGGIAAAPGAGMAAQPKAMAAGGIVGYAGPEGSSVEDPRRKRLEGETPAEYSRRMLELDLQLSKERTATRESARETERQRMLAERGGAAIPPSRLFDRKPLELPGAPAAAPAPAPARPPVSEAQATAAAGPQAAVPPAAKLPPANVVAAAQGAPKPPAPAGIAGLPGAAGAPPAGAAPAPAIPDFDARVKKASLAAAELDYMKQGRDEEARVEKRTALTPEQRGVYQEGIGGLQKFYDEQYDPERQRREGIKRSLIGAGGRRYGEFAAGAEAGMSYDDKQRAAKLKEFGDIQGAKTGLIGLDRGAVKSGIEAGAAVAKEGATTQRQGLASSTNVYSTDVGSRDKALDRVVEKLKVDAQNAATRANRENLSFERARTLYGTLMQRVQKAESELQENFEKGPLGTLLMQDPAKLKPEDRNRLEIAKLELDRQKKAMRKELAPVLESAAKQMGISNTDLSPADKAAIEKYTKGK
jgi:hypothetical protein